MCYGWLGYSSDMATCEHSKRKGSEKDLDGYLANYGLEHSVYKKQEDFFVEKNLIMRRIWRT